MPGNETRVRELLLRIAEDVPRARREIEERLAKEDYLPELPFSVGAPAFVSEVPTFAQGVSRSLTPMLRDRFEFGSTITRFYRVWLSPEAMREAMSQTPLMQMHESMRSHWEGSARNLYPDEQLSLFAIARENPEDLVYLIWSNDHQEPSIWESCGMDSRSFTSLEEYFESVLGR